MGEPLHNFENVIKAADIMVDEHGLQFSPRKVTISTSGLVPQIKRFLHESNCALAVSLNATTDEVLFKSFFFSFLLYSSLKTKYIPEILNLLCQNICICIYTSAGQKLDHAN